MSKLQDSPHSQDPASSVGQINFVDHAQLRAASRRRARKPLRAVISEPAEPMLKVAVKVAGTLFAYLVDPEWQGAEHIPQTGGVIFVANHIGNADPIALGQFLAWNGRWPRYMAKEEIFKTPVLGWIARHAGQIMVVRDSPQAKEAALSAENALREGKSVTVYPEGTITKDPLQWPMTAKTGAVRMSLETGAPIIPIGQWGAQVLIGGAKLAKPDFFPKKTVKVKAGPPVDLDDLRGRPITPELLEEGTERVLQTITDLVAELREEEPPATRWNYRLGRREEPSPEQHETKRSDAPDVEPRNG